MAKDLTKVNARPHTERVTLGTSNLFTRVDLPAWVVRVSIQFITNVGVISWDQAESDGQARADATRGLTANANSTYVVDLKPGDGPGRSLSVFLSSAVSSTVVEVGMS